MLVLVALSATGVGAAQALFATNDFGDYTTTQACLVRNGISVSGTLDLNINVPVYADCTQDYRHALAFTTLGGAAALPVAAWLLMVIGGLTVRWRLRSRRLADVPASALTQLTSRFNALCESQGVSGPRMVLAPPATNVTEAFTTGLPGARPWVVVPLAYAYTDQAEFDAVVLHELGHVRSRDVLWASAVWWAGWLVVPALLVALVPLMNVPGALWEYYGASVVIALIAAVSVLAVRAALLRRRELAADRHVVDVLGDPTALTTFVGGRRPQPASRLRRVFATHPPVEDRLRADTAAVQRWDGGFVFSTVVGIMAMLTFHGVHAILGDLPGFEKLGPTVATQVALGAAALLWASVVIPAWTRLAARTTPRWAGPWTGATLGLIAGYCLQPPGATATVRNFYAPHLPLLVVCLAIVALAVSVLTAAVATRLAVPADSRLRGSLSRLGSVVAVLVALAAGWSVVTSAMAAYLLADNAAAIRSSVSGLGSDRVWAYVATAILIGLALVVLRTRGFRFQWAVLATGVVGGVAAALSWLLRVQGDQTFDTKYLLVYERWWICAFAGLVTTLTVVIADRRRGDTLAGVPLAVVSGLLATALAGVIHHGILRVYGYGEDTEVFEQSLRLPGWLLVVVLIATLPVTLPVMGAMSRRNPRRGTVFWTVSAGGGTILLVLALLAGGLSWVTVTEHDNRESVANLANAERVPAKTGVPGDRGRPLDQAAVVVALSRLSTLLPQGSTQTEQPPTDPVTVTPASCDQARKALSAADEAMARSADLTHTYQLLEGTTLTASITSYVTPLPDLGEVEKVNRECAEFRLPNEEADTGYLEFSQNPGPTHGLPHRAIRNNVSAVGRSERVPITTVGQQYFVLIGHNVVYVDITSAYVRTAPPQADLQLLERLLTSTMDSLIGAL